MSLISYAQNFEDVMLWRALKHVKNGFYIDVGANDPTHDSVSRIFYENGWCGINIEPLLHHHADLVRDRSRDINLCCAVGAHEGELQIWETDVRGWATGNSAVIGQLLATGHEGTFHRVPMRTLRDICAEHSHSDIHFLKIDVEGFEQSVLQGSDFVNYRPWIVVVEATSPNSRTEVHQQWEHLLLNSNYSFVYADGLNRFYLADECDQLRGELIYPPNVFDNFIRSHEAQMQMLILQAETAVHIAEQRTQVERLRVESVEKQLLEIYSSNSWRITTPLRQFKSFIKRIWQADH
jgi:FkbM family methyltransferase